MADIGKRIKEKREYIGMTQEELATKLGYRNKSTIAKIETGANDIVQSKVIEFANALNTTVSYLMGWDTKVSSPSHGVVINVLGRVAAGIPLEFIEEIVDTEEITEDLARTGKFFGLRIKGDSMEPDIHDGDTVIVRQQDDAENDEIVIALVNGNDGVCKRLKRYQDSIALVSLNAKYEPMYFNQKEITDKPVRIIGKVVELRRKF